MMLVLEYFIPHFTFRPWPEVIEVLTGQTNFDVGPLREYFQPLMDWLTAENLKSGVQVGS